MNQVLTNISIHHLNIIFISTGILITLLTVLVAKNFIKKHRRYYYLINFVFIISFMIVIFTRNWMLFFVAWEMVTVTTALMLLWKGKGLASQYFIIQFLGSSILLMVIIMAINQGYPQIMVIQENWLQNLFIVGVGMKSALFGLHFWLPAIYSRAPVTFSALSSGLVVNLGFITLLKIIPGQNSLLIILGVIMIFLGGLRALTAGNYKVLLAYSTISQLGYIAIGIGSGTVYGYLGGILHILSHGLAKTGLFLGSGFFIKEYETEFLANFKNTWHRQKITSITNLIFFASLIGIPLLAGFNSNYLIKYTFKGNLFITLLLYGASLLTVLYSLRFLYWNLFKDIFQKKGKQTSTTNYQLLPIAYLVLLLIAVLLLAQGLTINQFFNILDKNITYNFWYSFLKTLVFILVSILILVKINWLQPEVKEPPSLDNLFKKVNKYLYQSGRFLYQLIYQEFQIQLLYIPLFLLLLLIWQFLVK